jgi:type II secretory pathway component PulJ
MILLATPRAIPVRRGFTPVELLISLALIVALMVVLTQAFTAASTSFRDLKAIGDQNERLRAAAQLLRTDLAGAHFDAAKRIADGLRTGVVDREAATELRGRYEAIAADADAFDVQLEEVEQKLVNPADKRIIRRVRGYLGQIQLTATAAAKLLELLDSDPDPNSDR